MRAKNYRVHIYHVNGCLRRGGTRAQEAKHSVDVSADDDERAAYDGDVEFTTDESTGGVARAVQSDERLVPEDGQRDGGHDDDRNDVTGDGEDQQRMPPDEREQDRLGGSEPERAFVHTGHAGGGGGLEDWVSDRHSATTAAHQPVPMR